MSYFEDLTDYTLMPREQRPGLVNIGWLDTAHAFLRGTVDEEAIERIWQFCRFPIVGTRGVHDCEFCQIRPGGLLTVTRGAESLRLGTAEIRVFGTGNRAYAAPDLIYHYILDHGYCPPKEFIEAVRQCPLPESNDYRQLLEQWTIDERELLSRLSWLKDQEALRNWHINSPRAELLHFRVQFSNGESITEGIVATPVLGSKRRILCSPAFVVGLTEGDEIEMIRSAPGYVMKNRGPNTACRVLFEESDIDEKKLFGTAQHAGGRVDGKVAFQGKTILVLTFPTLRVQGGVEQFMQAVKQQYSNCRVFDLVGGVSPQR